MADALASLPSLRPRLPRWLRPRDRYDARYGQILCLGALALVGVFVLDFGIPPERPLVILAAALAVQALASRLVGVPFDPKSAIITSLSLTFLLRADELWLPALAAAIAIGSKFTLRLGGRHVFNPANGALVVVTTLFEGAWVSPGQWGHAGLLAVAIAGFGAMVVGRAARADTTLAFLAAWAACLIGRAFWLGDPLAIPLHNLSAGAIWIFAFFMISDPATTPRTRAGRILHAVAVASLGWWLQANWLTETGPILALFLLAPLVAVIGAVGQARKDRPA